MALAEGGQVLLTRSPFDNARQVLKGQELPAMRDLAWLHHGPYVLKGLEEPLDIYEVGETATAPLRAPPNTEKAYRHLSPDQEPVLGWRPAVGQSVPATGWVLEEKLGEGGFGEVWLGRHQTLKEQRVFKFCFRADRVRSLRREVTLFRVLKEQVGEHPNIVGIREVFFEEPPYYLEMEHVAGRDLRSWSEAQGGVDKVSLEARLEIVAQVAEALQAAHQAGVIHRDVKPSNILIADSPRAPRSSSLTAKLTDFGIGQVVSEECLAGVTQAGFTQTMLGSASSKTGTQLYLAPELLAGQRATPRSDIYSLGVVLYQLLVGDLTEPITIGWAGRLNHRALKGILERCLAGDPEKRFAEPAALARELRLVAERLPRARQLAAVLCPRGLAGKIGVFLSLVVLASALARVAAGFLLVQKLEWLTYDWRARQAARLARSATPGASRIGLVLLTDECLRALSEGQLGEQVRFGKPWPRQIWGQLIRELHAEGAKTVAFDQLLGDLRPDHPAVKVGDNRYLGSDEYLARAMSEAGNVLLGTVPGLTPADLFRTNACSLGDIAMEYDADGVVRRAAAFRDYRLWLPIIVRWARYEGVELDQARIESGQLVLPRTAASRAKGPAVLPLDAEGRVALAPLCQALGEPIDPARPGLARPFVDQRIWNMGLQLAARELNLDLDKASVDLKNGQIVLDGPGAAGRVIPVDSRGFLYINWSLREPFGQQLPFDTCWRVLAAAILRKSSDTNVAAQVWRQRSAVIGSGLGEDAFTTPLGEYTPSAMWDWNIANTILANRVIRRSSPVVDLLLLLGMATLSAAFGWNRGLLPTLVITATLLVVYAGVGIGAYSSGCYWLPLVVPIVGAGIAVVLARAHVRAAVALRRFVRS
jgi:CHASE2 domain-containing sensor protein/tRNA A-37 threonylcarbamoyl transferase component Bud32